MIALPFIHIIEPRSLDFEVITLKQLQSFLQSSKGAKIVTLVTVTEPDLLKYKKDSFEQKSFQENPYLNNCVKVSRINCIVNFHYANAVNNQLEREGKEPNFEPQPRKWGTRLKDSPFVCHVNKDGENKLYLETKIQKYLGDIYYNPTTGLKIPDISPWLKEKKEEKVILRDYTVNNIATIMIDGQGYLIKENIE